VTNDGRWRDAWIAFTAIVALLWIMAKNRALRDNLWEQWLRVWGALP